MAGSVGGYSNQAIEALTEVLARFARPKHPEKSLAELRRLLENAQNSAPRPARTPRVRAVSTEQKLGRKQVEALLSRYREGGSANALGQEFDLSAASVVRLVRKHGLTVNDRLPSGDVIRQGTELYESGLSVQQVADRVGVPKSTLLKELKKAGVVMRQFKPPAGGPRRPESHPTVE